MATVDVSLLVPLLMVVVAMLANVAREVEVIEVKERRSRGILLLHGFVFEPLIRPVFDASLDAPGSRAATEPAGVEDALDHAESDGIPHLGRFNQIHAFNSFLIGVILMLCLFSLSGFNAVLLGGTVTVFWMTLPIVEINEYDRMMQTFPEGERIDSFSFHLFVVAALGVLPTAFSWFDLSTLDTWVKALVVAAFLAAAVLVGNRFLVHLDDELALLVRLGESE